MKVTRRCRESGIEMMTHDLLVSRTTRGLAARIVNRGKKLHASDTCMKDQVKICPSIVGFLPIAAHEVETAVPATPYQNQMYQASHSHAGRPYFATYLAEVRMNDSRNNVDVERFSQAWQSVVDRHPIMRTLFMVNPSNDTLYQIVLRGAQANITIQHVESDLSPVGQLLADHVAFTQRFTTEPTGIMPAPAHEISLYQSRSGTVFLRMSLSHLLTDTVALEHMFADMDAFYNRCLPERPTVDFVNYARWFKPDAVAANNKVWQEKILQQARACFLLQPGSMPLSNPPQSIHEISLPFSIPSSQRKAMSDFCKAAQVTIPSLFSFCWALLLKRYTQQDSVCFGQLVAGRDAPVDGLEDIVGPVLGVLPISVDLSSSPDSLLELIQQFQKANSEATAYQPCSLKCIERLMGCSADRGLFNTIVNVRKVHYQGQELKARLERQSLQFKLIEKHDASEVRSSQSYKMSAGNANRVPQYDLVLQVDEKEGNISGALTFWNHQFEVDEVQALLEVYLSILNMVLRSLEATVAEVISKL